MAQQTKIKGKLQGNVPAFLRDSRDHLSEREREKKVFEGIPDNNKKLFSMSLPYGLTFFNTMKEMRHTRLNCY
jgi:hypothetical protein